MEQAEDNLGLAGRVKRCTPVTLMILLLMTALDDD